MISKQELIERAREWGLRVDVVEKDYALGWLLAAISQHEEAAELWVLKGGTCVKKCFFETYRFSEDLDFSLLPEAEYDESAVLGTLREVAALASDLSGIDFSQDQITLHARKDRLGRATYEGRIGYRGPLAMPSWPRVLFDLTQHEPVLDEPVLRRVLHPYSDDLPIEAGVRTYTLEELLAEKTRALVERCRPRDLYDVVFIIGNATPATDHARELFREKCSAKGITVPDAAGVLAIIAASGELHSEWEHMLGHQLPQLPPVDTVLVRVPAALRWLEPERMITAPQLQTVPALGGEAYLTPAPIGHWQGASGLEQIRFAGANRLIVHFRYSDRIRAVEPYSLRRSSKGNVLLHAWEIETSQIKRFDVAKIADVRVTDRGFAPRYQVEFTAGGSMDMVAPIITSSAAASPRRYPRSRQGASGPTYVFTCPLCGKEFRHRRNDSALRRHKMKDSEWYCAGRSGYLNRVI